MRRLLLSAAALAVATLPAAPASAGPAACVVASGFPVCAGTCSAGDPITVYGVSDSGAETVTASCGGGEAECTTFRLACSGSDQATGSGRLSCDGPALLVVCVVGVTASS